MKRTLKRELKEPEIVEQNANRHVCNGETAAHLPACVRGNVCNGSCLEYQLCYLKSLFMCVNGNMPSGVEMYAYKNILGCAVVYGLLESPCHREGALPGACGVRPCIAQLEIGSA